MNTHQGITIHVVCILSIVSFMLTQAVAQELDVKGSKDHPLVTRMPDFYIGQYEENEFDLEKFKTDEGTVNMEGHKYMIDYRLQSGVTPSGKMQILKNYKNALQDIGAEVMLEGSYYYVFRIVKDDKETWVKVDPGNYDGKRYTLTIVERAAMTQEVFANAAAMKNGIVSQGHIALYGIYFDSGKAIVKDGSEKTIKEIANFLQDNSTINLYIVGHTDSDGDLYSNMELSIKRAAAVIDILVEQYKIDRNRLDPKGLGPLSPVASNRTAEGKAKNRRVDLVEKMN